MDPITLLAAGAGVSAVSSLANAFLQRRLGRDAARREDARIAEVKALQERAAAQLELPPGSVQPLTFEEYAVLATFEPQFARFVAEQRPELISEPNSQAEIQAQSQALEEMQRRSQEPVDVQAREIDPTFVADPRLPENRIPDVDLRAQAEQEAILNQLQGADAANRANLMRDYAQRGIAGSGQELAMQLGAGAQAQENARQLALNSLAQQQDRRLGMQRDLDMRTEDALSRYDQQRMRADELLASRQDSEFNRQQNQLMLERQRRDQLLSQAANLASQIRGQNLNVESANKQQINEFNRRNTQNIREYERYRADLANKAQQFNQQNKQEIFNKNVALRNQMGITNQERQEAAAAGRLDAKNRQTMARYGMGMEAAKMGQQADAARMARQAGIIGTFAQMPQNILSGAAAGAQISRALSTPSTAGVKSSTTPSFAGLDPKYGFQDDEEEGLA